MKREVKWLSWAGKEAYVLLPAAKKVALGLKTDRQIVLRAIVCGQESMAKEGLIYPASMQEQAARTDLNNFVCFYRPAPIDLYNFNDHLELYNPQNFFINFCVNIDSPNKMIQMGRVSLDHFTPWSSWSMEPIGTGNLIVIKRRPRPLAELIDNNLFVYVDLLSGRAPLTEIFSEIVEEVNKIM